MPPAAPSPMMGTPPGGVSGAPAGAFPGAGDAPGAKFVPHKRSKGRKHLSRKGKHQKRGKR
jgi:hypothetical protein